MYVTQVSFYSQTLGVAIAQTTYATDASGEILALRLLLEAVELEGVLVQADALHANPPFFLYLAQRGADFLIAVKHGRHKGFRLIRDRLTYGLQILASPGKQACEPLSINPGVTW